MTILLTGANGYIGLRLLPSLLERGHTVLALVRDPSRFPGQEFTSFLESRQLRLLTGDLLAPHNLPSLPSDLDVAYYLLHSMGSGEQFAEKEATCAKNFLLWVEPVSPKSIVYLSGLVPSTTAAELSPHLASREHTNNLLRSGSVPVTTLRASIIVGSGSASFEIIRDLAEKLPFMLTPRWTHTRCQPIAIRNVIGYLTGLLDHPEAFGSEFDIGGPQVLTYQDLLRRYAKVRQLQRYIISVPFLTPNLSARWLYLVTATSYPLAQSLVRSLINETVCQEHQIRKIIPQDLLSYEEAIEKAFVRIAQNRVPSSWFDSLASGRLNPVYLRSVQVPSHGVLTDKSSTLLRAPRDQVIDAIWAIGGDNGWPSMDWAWKLRGFLDKIIGGIGIRRGRRHPTQLNPGDALDFWRVILADREDPKAARLILAAEMRVPGEAWLEFEVTETKLFQTATFRPRGLLGRLYWYSVLPFHLILFPQMLHRLARGKG